MGREPDLGLYVILGAPPRNHQSGELDTIIGDRAVIRSHTVIYAGNRIGHAFQTGHGALVRECNEIGDDVSIGSHAVVEHHVTIGDGVRIHTNAFVPEYSILEDGSWIGPNAVLTNALHPLCPEAKRCLKGPHVKQGAKIGANATLLPGITVGRDAVVGAGSVVVHDVPDGAVVVGAPARVVKSIDELTCPYDIIDRPYGGERR